ncbi:MAG: S8 family serine peptidase [Longicatena sp.]
MHSNKKRVKIAVIDSGYNQVEKNIRDHVVDNISFIDNNGVDENGHGTNCIDTILSSNHNVDIVSIKITNHLGLTKIELLNKALEYCINSSINILNISISCRNNEKKHRTEHLLKQLYDQNKIIISSVANNLDESYPASSKYVIGVAGIELAFNKDLCLRNKNIYYFDNTPIFVHGTEKQKYNFFRGNSKACAHCAGMLSLFIEDKNYIFENITSYLKRINIEFTTYKKEFRIYTDSIQKNDEKNLIDFDQKIIKLVNTFINNISDIEIDIKNNLNKLTFSTYTMINDFNFIEFINYMEDMLNIKISYHHIKIEKIFSIKLLLKFIENEVCQYEKKKII